MIAKSIGQRALLLGGIANYLIALIHLIIIFLGAPGYRYFGVPDLALLIEKGSLIPLVITLFLFTLFFIFATYAFSGAGFVRSLPFLKTTIMVVTLLYLMRGLVLVPDFIRYLNGNLKYTRALVFSSVSLFIGSCYLFGSVWLIFYKEKLKDA